jgi:protein-export membrane protein SecD
MIVGPTKIERRKAVLLSIFIIILTAFGVFFATPKRISGPWLDFLPWKEYSLGLDISGGTSLIYRADLSNVDPKSHSDAMEGLKDVIERRVNLFGVKEPRVEVARQSGEWRLIVELAGIKDINEAIKVIGSTPFLEFRRECTEEERKDLPEDKPCFKPTGFTGKYLKRAEMVFHPTTGEPVVSITFNEEGAKIFAELTKENLNKLLAIYLDGAPISIPRVNEVIPSGEAQITGKFTIDEAKTLARRLNEGALPVPIELISQRTIGATLGEGALKASIKAGILGFILVVIFMILFYRGAGLAAVFALCVYTIVVLSIFKIIPVTLTLSGIAGFILSIGMAVDANILIFERTKEELRKGKNMMSALNDGFLRAWPSIRDSNVTTIITSIVLYTFATSIIKGFALTLLIGVLASMFSAITVTRLFLISILGRSTKWWFGI